MARLIRIIGQRGSSDAEPKYTLVDTGKPSDDSSMFAARPGLTKDEAITWLIREGASSYHEVLHKLAEADRLGEGEIAVPVRIGPRIVRVWFDSVFTPLISELRTEMSLLDQGNWTYSYRSKALEYIRPIHAYLEPSAVPNLDHVLDMDGEISFAVSRHDDTVSELKSTAERLHSVLTLNEGLQSALDETTEPQALSELGYASRDAAFGAYPPEDHCALIAQYVVNHVPGLPPWVAAARLWNKHGKRFMDFLSTPGIAPYAVESDAVGGRLKAESISLRSLLEQKRLQLSFVHDVPYSAPSSGVPAA